MESSKKTGLQKPANAATKPNTDTKQGVCNKEKFALWVYPDTMEEVSAAYENDNCKSKSEFIEKAIRFYLGYLKQERNDTDKLHSLAELEVISTRDVARFLVEKQLKSDNNTPTNNFWTALRETSDYYTFDDLYEFVSSVTVSDNLSEAIPQNMWRLNLLQDAEILGTKSKPEERLAKNRDLIFAIGQLSEESRKKLSRSLARTKAKYNDYDTIGLYLNDCCSNCVIQRSLNNCKQVNKFELLEILGGFLYEQQLS